MRISSYLPVLAALVAGVLLSLIAANVSARMIENTSQTAVEKKLRLEGYEWAQVQTDGLQVVLTGTAPDERAQLAAQRAAGHVVDPARVINVMNVVQREAIPDPRFSIEILRNDSGISLIGLVPTAWDKAAFLERLQATAGTGSVADFLEQADYAAPDAWGEAVSFGLTAIGLLPRAKISLAADGVTVTGLADSREQQARFERTLAAAIPSELAVTVDISAPRPVITPFTMRAVLDEGGPRFDACTAETPQGHARILAAARALGISDPECTIGLGAPSAAWASAVETGLRSLGELGRGTITFSDGDVTLQAEMGTEPALFDKVAGELEAALPRGFALTANLPENTSDAEGDDQPQFVATRSPEGQVQLRGRITDDRARQAAEAFARAAFGSQSVYSAMRLDDTLPEGWSVRTLAALEALSKLSQGAVIMEAETLSIKGETGSATARADIAGLLADKLGDSTVFDIDIAYVRKLDPVLNLPTPQECVDKANRAISATKIVFDPGSVELNPTALETLDRVAKALADCEDMDMEIGAHSDSQGGEEMNLQLSQQRANSVLDALLARRVIGVHFTAKGYGESMPIADNDTEEGREANRRIEFSLMEAEGHDHDHGDDEAETTDTTPPEGEDLTAQDEGTEASNE